jgi:hypothetical protein
MCSAQRRKSRRASIARRSPERLWEREDRTAPPEDEEPSSGTVSGALQDLIERDQEHRNDEPPAGPVPENT